MKSLVVARYKEDVSWLSKVSPEWTVKVYDKGAGDLPNFPGREAHTYLHHIVMNLYQQGIGDETAFVQGNPFDHCPSLLSDLESPTVRVYGNHIEDCDPDGMPRIHGMHLNDFCRALDLPELPRFKFVAGAQFRITCEQLLHHSIKDYAGLLFLCKTEPLSGYIMERLWNSIFELGL
jgi:hypothetical protein